MQIASSIKHGEFDQNGRWQMKRLAQLGVHDLAFVHRTERQQGLLSLGDSDGSTALLLDDKGTIGLDHLGAAGTSKDHGTLALVQSVQSLLVGGELDEGKWHVVGVATNLNPAFAVLQKLAVDGSLEGNVILGLRQARGR